MTATCTNNAVLGDGKCGREATDYREPKFGQSPAFACTSCRHEMSGAAASWRSLHNATPAQHRNWKLAVMRHQQTAARRTAFSKMSEGADRLFAGEPVNQVVDRLFE